MSFSEWMRNNPAKVVTAKNAAKKKGKSEEEKKPASFAQWYEKNRSSQNGQENNTPPSFRQWCIDNHIIEEPEEPKKQTDPKRVAAAFQDVTFGAAVRNVTDRFSGAGAGAQLELAAGWNKKYAGQNYSQLRAAQENLDAQSEEYQWLGQYAPTQIQTAEEAQQELDVLTAELEKHNNTWYDATDTNARKDYDQQLEQLNSKIREMEKKKTQLAGAEKSNVWSQKYNGQTYDQLKAALQELEKGSEEYQWLSRYAADTMTAQDMDRELARLNEEKEQLTNQTVDMTDTNARQAYDQQMEDLIEQIQTLEDRKWKKQREDRYNILPKETDFAENSAVKKHTRTQGFGIGIGDAWWGAGDPKYDYINDLENVRAYYYNLDGHNPYDIYDRMDQTEISIYNYLYNTEGKESAEEYLEYLEYSLNERGIAELTESMTQFAQEYPRLSSVTSVPMNLLGGVGYMDMALQKLKNTVSGENKPIDYNRPAMTPSVGATTIRQTVSQDITDKHGVIELDEQKHPVLSKILNGKGLADVYQLGMSAADSAAVALLSPVLGEAGVALLGGSAATQGVLTAVENGATEEQALTMGLINGAAEIVFENISLKSLLDGPTDSLIKSFLKQGMEEGREEVLTSITNNLADVLVMAEKSGYLRNVEQYKSQGKTEAEAVCLALTDMAIELGWDYMGGMLSGGVMGGGSYAYNQAAGAVESKLQQMAQQMYGVQTGNNGTNTPNNGTSTPNNGTSTPNNGTSTPNNGTSTPNNGTKTENTALKRNGVRFSFRMTQNDIDSYVDAAYQKENTEDYKKYAVVSDELAADLQDEIDLTGYAHALRDNDIRHIRNSHGENTNEKYPVTKEDIKQIPWIVENYDKVYVVRRSEGKTGIVYIKVMENGQVYYLEQATTKYGNEPLLVNKQMIKTGIGDIPDLKGLKEAITKKQSESEFLNDLYQAQQVYAQSVYQTHSNNTIFETDQNVNKQDSTATGQVIRKDGQGETAQVASVSSAGDGKLTLQLTDGTEVDVSELSFPDAGEQMLYQTVAQIAGSTVQAQQLLEGYQGGKVNAENYARGLEEAYLYGKLQFTQAEMAQRGSFVSQLSADQRNAAYAAGQYAGEKAAAKRQQEISGKGDPSVTPDSATGQTATLTTAPRNDKKGQLYFEGSRSGLTDRQKVSLKACEVIAKALGIKVYVFESKKDSTGKRIGENGWYDPKDGSIHIDINAGNNGEGVAVFTLAHELTHFIRDWSPAKYRTLAGFLAEQYGEKGISVRDMVLLQQQRAERDGRKLTFEQAHEEWVADCMESMLTDGAILEKLSMLQAKDASLAQKIRQFLEKFLQRLKDAYKGVSPQTAEGRIVSQMVDKAQQLRDLFAEALIDAGEKYQNADENIAPEGGKRFQARNNGYQEAAYQEWEVQTALYDALDRADRGRSNLIKVGQLPHFVTELTEIAGDFYIYRNHAYENMVSAEQAKKDGRFSAKSHYHNLGIEKMTDAIMALENPIMTITTKTKTGNPAVIMLLPVEGKNNAPLYAVLSFYSNRDINGDYTKKPHMVLTVAERNVFEDGGRMGLIDVIDRAVKDNQVISLDKKMRDYLSVKTKAISLGIITEQSLTNNIARFRKEINTFKKENNISYSTRDQEGVSPRQLLLNTVEGMVRSSAEWEQLQKYRKMIKELNATEEHLERIKAELKKLYFTEGIRDYDQINALKEQQKKALDKLNRYDGILISLENTKPIRDIVERMQEAAFRKGFEKAKTYYREKNQTREQEIRQHYQESRRQALENRDKAQVRQQIRKDVERLDGMLNRGNKQKNVKQELKAFAGAALRTAKGTFLKGYNEYDMVRNGITGTMSREHKQILQRCQELLAELDRIRDEKNAQPAGDNWSEKWDPEADLRRDDREEALKKELAKNMAVLREANIFKVENELMEDSNADQLMDELLSAYKALKDSELAHVRGVYSDVIYGQIESVKKFLAGKAIKDMTTVELKELQKMYRLVLHTITTSNDLFVQKRKADVRKLGEEVIQQLQTAGKDETVEILEKLKRLVWSNLKPETALELIGSDTLTEMMQGLYRGEDTYALDIEQARKFAQEQADKYGRKKWDMEKPIPFAGTTITLGQAMSLYAYTKRKQAQGHLEGDGFTSSSNVRIKKKGDKLPVELSYIKNATKTHTVSREMYEKVGALLTPQQKKYADAMQEYLSKTMGAKGNEVAMTLYGIPLFEETAYFPIKTASEYHEEALGAKTGDVKLKNSGFTKSVQEKASNPIVLDDFESVWAAHVDKMSLYHGFVLPMEDFDRVYNYHRTAEQEVTDAAGEVYRTELVDTNETVKIDIENKAGKAANEYITTFMQQLNGGVRGDSTEKLFGGMVKSFKKTAVLGSLSVAVQQPTAFIRAMAHLDMQDIADFRNWLGKKGKPDGKLVEEMYKYAPVALMKHIGGFDPGLGRTSKDYIFKEKLSVRGALERATGWLPERMDEWTWTYIWLCTKRQIHRQNPQLRVGSKAFCEKAGERFSQIIRDTQVYDSVLTKSQMMRSKNMFLQMATSFMNEPTTSLDMYIRSTIQAKRGKITKKQAARTYASVIGSQILCAAVAAFVYAARDDDEDETYWEKYVSAAIDKAKEGILPWYSIPFVKDIFSVFEGYDVERSDMSLITDLYQAMQKLESDNATPWEKTESFVGSILNIFGIPLKNVSRDVRGIYNTIKQLDDSTVQATKAGMKYAVLEGLTGEKASKAEQLQNAITENDAAHILRVMATYDKEDSAVAAFREAVKEAYTAERITEETAVEHLQVYGGLEREEAQGKVLYWQAKTAQPDTVLKESWAQKWSEELEGSGITLETYTEYRSKTADLEGDKDKNGETISGSKKKKVLAVINGLQLTRKQKDILYLSAGYAESDLNEAPWN